MKARIKSIILLIALIGIDQLVNLMNKAPIIIIPNKILNLQYYENTGAVWGILSGKVDLLKILTLMILLVIIFLYFKIPDGKRYNALKLVAIFIVAGALGNLIDRFFLGHVVDFIYFEFINFPLFNFADCYLTLSSIVLVFLALFYYKDEDFVFLEDVLGKKKKSVKSGDNIEEEKEDIKEEKVEVKEDAKEEVWEKVIEETNKVK